MTRMLAPWVGLLLLPAAALAAGDADRFLACADHDDDTARLACYDRAAGALRQSPATEAVAAARDAEPPQETGEPPSAEEEVDSFGMTWELAREQPEAQEQEEELREMTAVVVELSERPRGEKVITLDNGQIWTEKDAVRAFRVRVGDTVVIKKGALGGYRMVGRGRRASAVRRVR